MTIKTWLLSTAFVTLIGIAPLHAQDDPAAEQAPDPEWVAAMQAMVEGPDEVSFVDQAKFTIPRGYGFVPVAQAKPLMEKMGNRTDDRFIGLIFPLSDESNWFVAVDYEPSGYIKDED